jgi:Flp pilus assembly protein TadD
MPLLIAACASDPLPAPPAAPAVAPEAMVAAVRAAAGDADDELAVQPLRDPMVEDLRRQAAAHEQARRHDAAAATLDEALQATPDDPAVLQERAEAALLLGDFAGAENFAHKAWTLGAKVGPLCRRHWEAIAQARLARADAAGAAQARQAGVACTVEGPARY